MATKLYRSEDILFAIRKAGPLPKVRDNKKVEYFNYPFAFDIETTSFTVQSNGQEKKQACMYIWTLAIGEIIVQGRTWREFVTCCEEMAKFYDTSNTRRLVIYVHNLSFEFQFMHKWFKWLEVFALKKRQPVRALTTLGIEFRCSYKLSGYSLAKLGDQLTEHDVKKLSGDLDYSKKRNSKTPLTEQENAYCINDVLVVTAYIDEYIKRVGGINLIPMTKTGEVRNFTRNYCFTAGVRSTRSQIHLQNIVS